MGKKKFTILFVSMTIGLFALLYGCTTSHTSTPPEWFYYSDNGLYKLKRDGSYSQKLSTDWALNIQVAGDWIYYTRNKPYESRYMLEQEVYDINDTYEETYELIKIKTDGSEKTIIKSANVALTDSNGEDTNNVFWFTVSDDTIYYTINTGALYRMDVNGGNEQRLLDDVGDLNVYQDWIIYTSEAVGKLYKMKRDGTQNTLISDDELELIGVSNGFIYCTKRAHENVVADVYQIGLHDSKISLVKQGFWGTESKTVFGEFLYYLSTRHGTTTVERMDLTDGQTTELFTFSEYSHLQVSEGEDHLLFHGYKSWDDSDSAKEMFKLMLGDTKVEKFVPKS